MGNSYLVQDRVACTRRLITANGGTAQDGVANMYQRRAFTDGPQDVLRYPLHADDAARQHRRGWRVDVNLTQLNPFGEKGSHLPQSGGIRPARAGGRR